MQRRALALVVLLLSVAVAGCATGPGGDGTDPTTGDADAAALAADAADAMAAVDHYRVSATVEQTVTSNGQQRSATVNSTGAFDREERAFRIEQTASVAGQSREGETYLVNGTLYERAQRYERLYGSAWISVDLGADLAETWRAQDTLARQRYLLENASVDVAGTETVDGVETTVLRVDGNETAYEDVVEDRLGTAGGNVSVAVENVTFTYYVAAADHRLVRSTGSLETTVTQRGRSVSQTQRVTLSFGGYGDPVDVSLPSGADLAVDVTNRTGGG